ncbi:MAG: right-handed parallel beta-helix repeat-containing protein, partial [Verrucomicrobia bacterium]|nr:right-handed parallel beta-helix repeat-containing protein [Verrucomicrobiota bacterium]
MKNSVQYGSDALPALDLRLGVSSALASAGWRSGLSRIRVGIRSPHNLNLPSPISHLPSSIFHSWQRLRPCALALSALLVAFFFLPLAQAADFYVATNGSDSNPGTIGQPFATLSGARTAIRALPHPISVPFTVWLRGGRYYFQTPFALSGSQDSGTGSAPITYRNYAGETPYLIGGTNVSDFQAVTNTAILARLTGSAKTNILVANLAAQGITNLGAFVPHGYAHDGYDQAEAPWQSELLFQDQRMQLARYPNTNTWLLTTNTTPQTATSFSYSGNEPSNWVAVTDAWVYGYWPNDYSDSFERVASIDTKNKVVNLVPPCLNYSGQVGVGKRFYFLNVLEELDSAGEYYIDRTNGLLYFWPPSTITNGACIVSLAINLVTLTGVSNVAFSGITFEAGKSVLLLVNGGQSNLITGCVIKGGSADGIKIVDSLGTGVSWCTLTDLGQRGVRINKSGIRSTLTSGNNFIAYNTISNVARLCRCYKPPIDLCQSFSAEQDVVGVYMGHNVIHDCPHTAIILFGNNHVIEYNEIYRVCTETADAGAIYSGYDWTFRGTVIRYNYLHDINAGGSAEDWSGVIGIYADAAWSGVTIYGNVFCNVDQGICINGGRDNIIQNNIFVDCTNTPAGTTASYAIAVGQCGTRNGFTNAGGTMMTRLAAMPYQTPPWSTEYPALASILSNHPELALGNVISTNISYNNGSAWIVWEEHANTNVTVMNNFTSGDPLFVDYSHRNFA